MKILRILIITALALLALAPAARAEDPAPPVKIEKRQLLVPPKGENVPPAAFSEDPVQWVREKQQDAYRLMASSLRGMRGEGSPWAAWSLILLSLGYGVLHAAGPGHGKAVISAWLLATGNDLKRGLTVSFLSSVIQALSAIVIVSAVLFVFAGAVNATRTAAGVLETLSYGLIGLLGLYLIWTAFRRPAAAHVHHHDHHHHHHDHHDHSHCDHVHMPEVKTLRGNWSLAKAASLSFAIGVRPCTGAILVLLAAYPLGLYWAGIAAAFAMSAGTFLTVSVIAALTVYAEALATRLAGRDRPWFRWAEVSVRIAAGVVIALLGGLLFWASLGSGASSA